MLMSPVMNMNFQQTWVFHVDSAAQRSHERENPFGTSREHRSFAQGSYVTKMGRCRIGKAGNKHLKNIFKDWFYGAPSCMSQSHTKGPLYAHFHLKMVCLKT